MASYDFTSHVDGAIAFDPSTDVLSFPDGYGATGLSLVADGGDTLVFQGAQVVRLTGVLTSSLDGSQFSFADGSLYRVGTTASESFTGSAQGDQFDLRSGGRDFVSAGGGDDAVRVDANMITVRTTIDGGPGSGDELHISGVSSATEILADYSVTGFERYIFGSGAIRLQLHQAMFNSSGYAVTFDASGQGATDSLSLNASFWYPTVGTEPAAGTVVSSVNVVGGAGADTVVGGRGGDHLAGGAGADLLSGFIGDDTLVGGEGADWLYGGDGSDSIEGGAGNDTLLGGQSESAQWDTLSGGDGDDWLYAGGASFGRPEHPALLTGGTGADTFVLDAGPDANYNILGDALSMPAHPAHITDFNLAEGDRLLSGIEDGRFGGKMVVWRGEAAEGFTGALGQHMTLAGVDTDDRRFVEFWTAYDATFNETILFVDRDGDGHVGAYDLKIVFDGHVQLSPEMFADASFFGQAGTPGADTDTDAGLTETADLAFGRAGDDTLSGLGGNDTINGDAGADHLDGGVGSDQLHGGTGDDDLAGGHDSDYLFGGFGSDTLWGGSGDDWLYAAGSHDWTTWLGREDDGASDFLHGGSGDDHLEGDSGADHLFGDEDDDTLEGWSGNDTLEGGDGADLLEGGEGRDSLVGGAGNDTLRSGAFEAPAGQETLDGGEGDDWLYSGRAQAVMSGGAGADIFVFHPSFTLILSESATVATPGRITDFDASEGDRIHTDITTGESWDVPIIWRGWADAAFTATEGQSLALAGADVADPRYLEFWTAYDPVADVTILFMDRNGDFVVDAGDLKIVFDGQVALTPGSLSTGTILARRGTAAADDADSLPWTELADMLLGVRGADTLFGGGGDDTLSGSMGADVLEGDSGNDQVLGGRQDDLLGGGSGDDTLAGGSGSDTLRGGAGSDLLYSAFWQDHEGWFAYDHPTDHNELWGGGGMDGLIGGAGNDELHGGRDADQLYGESGDDTLDGGEGWDMLAGGAGDDTYILRDLDAVGEQEGAGVDRVLTTLPQYTLAANVERGVILSGPGATLEGNALDNHLTGGDGNDTLDGGLGSDTLAGGRGHDTYHVDDVGDRVVEQAGAGDTDLVNASVSFTLGGHLEHLHLLGESRIDAIGNGLDNMLVGNGAANRISGRDGDDAITGRGGGDTLSGGDGADRFIFGRAPDSSRSARDVVTDFVRGLDRIDLGTCDANAIADGQQHFTFIGSASFGADATGQLRFAVEDGGLVLYGSTDADADAEFAVQLLGVTRLDVRDLVL